MCKITITHISRIIAVCVGILIVITSIVNIFLLGLFSLSNLIMSLYYL